MAKNEHGTSLASIEEGVTVTGNVKEKAAHLAVRQGDQRSSEQMDEQGGSNWPKFEDADYVSGNRSRAFTAHPAKTIPENSFKPAPRKLICWNCGDGHHLKDCKKPKDQKKIELARSKFRPRGNRRFQPQGRRDDKSNKSFNQNHRRAHLLEQGKRRVKGAHATPGGRAPPAEVNQVDKIADQEANVAA